MSPGTPTRPSSTTACSRRARRSSRSHSAPTRWCGRSAKFWTRAAAEGALGLGGADDDGAEGAEGEVGHAPQVGGGNGSHRGDIAVEELVAHPRRLVAGEIPGLARIGAPVHGE